MTGSIIEVTPDIAAPANGANHVLYAAAFIDPSIESVRMKDGRFVFRLAQQVPVDRLTDGLRVLIDRFSKLSIAEVAPVFSLALPPGKASQARLDTMMHQVHPGLWIYRKPLSTLIRFLDAAILRRFAQPFGAMEEAYPNCIPVAKLGRAHHLSSFPEHLHFLTHLRQDLSTLDGFAAQARGKADPPVPGSGEISVIKLVQNPSTCYHCYASRAGTDLTADTAVTAVTRCHRFEAANHSDFGRLLEFSLREVIFLGSSAFAESTRERTLDLVRQLASDWQLYGELVASNDPFFTSDYEMKASHQHRMVMKYEYRAFVPGQDRPLAVMSSNLHGPTFGRAFDIRLMGRVMQTGCLGFGLERLALALAAQHGTDPAAWPRGLAADYEQWRISDPLQP